MINDPIGDFLARIRNAQARKHDFIVLPSTKMLVAISEILKKEGFVIDFKVEEKTPQNELKVTLKYVNEIPAIRELSRVSKPGVRKYYGYKDIKPVMNGLGIAIFSTPMGIITGEAAVKSKVGGEYLCFVY
jgi:small subunit ribosomal protein S8